MACVNSGVIFDTACICTSGIRYPPAATNQPIVFIARPAPPKQVIREGHLRTALSWLRALEPGFERAIGETAAARRLTVADTVLRYLRRPRNTGKWVARREIQRRLWHRCQSGKELRLALDTLVEIEKGRMGEGERGRVEDKARRGVGLSAAGEVTATE